MKRHHIRFMCNRIDHFRMTPGIGLSTQAATLISGVIGGIIGSFGTYYGQSRLQNKRNSERSDWLRHVLLSELESMKALDNWPLDPPDGGIPKGDWLHNQVFNNMSTELGMLSSDELNALVKFHGEATHVRTDIQSLLNSPDDWNDTYVNLIQSHLADVKRERQAAMHMLSEKINKKD